eukprot:3117320-Pleurochrysis_carterae.AAC.1
MLVTTTMLLWYRRLFYAAASECDAYSNCDAHVKCDVHSFRIRFYCEVFRGTHCFAVTRTALINWRKQ